MVRNEADGVGGARRLFFARVDAVFVRAGSVAGAVVVRVALGSLALHERISFQSWWALASSAMVAAVADGGDRAWIGDRAWVDALSVVAGLVVGALRVVLAAQLEASKLWISRVAGFARTDWMVVGNEAVGVVSAVAGTHATLVDARLGLLAFSVRSTADLGFLDGRASDFGVSVVAWGASADASVVLDVAESFMSARVPQAARVDAPLVVAGAVVWAVVVLVAFGGRDVVSRDQRALDVRVSLVFRCTCADCAVALRETLSVDSTALSFAGVDAGASDALIGVGAVSVHDASRLISDDRLAVSVHVGYHVSWTLADQSSERNCVEHSTRLVATADVASDAGVLAVLVDAGKLRVAIGVTNALWFRR